VDPRCRVAVKAVDVNEVRQLRDEARAGKVVDADDGVPGVRGLAAAALAGLAGAPVRKDWRMTSDDAMANPEPVDPGWTLVSIGFESDPVDLGGGARPWAHGWTATGRRVLVAHPSYPRQRHHMTEYTLDGVEPTVTFAAGEFSNGVWGFFVPGDDA